MSADRRQWRLPRIGLLAAIVTAAAGSSAVAQSAGPDAAGGLRGDWKRAGAGFSCVVRTDKPLPPDAIKKGILVRACQRMGPFVVGDSAKKVTSLLGAPHRTLSQPNGQIAWVYFVEQRDHHPYLIVTVAKTKVVALQVTGPTAAKEYAFNQIELGLPAKELLARFGSPSHLEPSEEKDTELWSYNPWPFSFEVRDDRVSSIRISEP